VAVATSLEHDMTLNQSAIAALLFLFPGLLGAEPHVVIVEGLGGDAIYTQRFADAVAAIEAASRTMTSADHVHVFRGGDANRETISAHFDALRSRVRKDDPVIVYLIGHGSFDDIEYKFNIPGPDLTDADLAKLLDGLPSNSQLLVNTSSASGATLERLEKPGRVLITATRSGVERHATRFGAHFADALGSGSADVDKNRLITAEEAFRYAERQVADFFDSDGRLSTEHARLQGDRAPRVTLARLGAARPSVSDARLAEMFARREALNAEVESLRQRRDDMDAGTYQAELLQKMLELAQLEDSIETRERVLNGDD
jgi:hypothetical protein